MVMMVSRNTTITYGKPQIELSLQKRKTRFSNFSPFIHIPVAPSAA
jgi:hypothetical protein